MSESLGQSGGRTLSEIDTLIAVLRNAWRDHPRQRLCQLIVNASERNDPFYVEDDDLAMALIEYDLPTPPSPLVGADDEHTPRGRA